MGTVSKTKRGFAPFPACFSSPKKLDPLEVYRDWRAYKLRNDSAAFHRLVQQHLWQVKLTALKILKQKPDRFNCLDDMLSDGVIGLLRAFEKAQLPEFPDGIVMFRSYASTMIRGEIYRGPKDRAFGGRERFDRRSFLETFRAKLVQRLGRLPHDSELNEAIISQIQNPHLYIVGPHMHASGGEGELAVGSTASLPSSVESPDQKLLNDEVMKVAMRGLNAEERKWIKAVLSGKSICELADKWGIERHTLSRNINRVLWRMRMNPQLADYLGVERQNDEIYTPGSGKLIGISEAPPVRLARVA